MILEFTPAIWNFTFHLTYIALYHHSQSIWTVPYGYKYLAFRGIYYEIKKSSVTLWATLLTMVTSQTTL